MRFVTVLPVLIGLSLAFVSPVLAQRAPAQRKVPAHQTYERITAVVPIVGTGTKADPKRPPTRWLSCATSWRGMPGIPLKVTAPLQSALRYFPPLGNRDLIRSKRS